MKLTPRQIADFLDTVAQSIAELEHIPIHMSLDALCKVCTFYDAPDEQIAMDVYYYLRNKEENRAMVHQFRENVRAYQQELDAVSESMRRKQGEWT